MQAKLKEMNFKKIYLRVSTKDARSLLKDSFEGLTVSFGLQNHPALIVEKIIDFDEFEGNKSKPQLRFHKR